MRNLTKLEEPEILKQHAENWLKEYLQDKANSTKKYRYRHKDIKETLKTSSVISSPEFLEHGSITS